MTKRLYSELHETRTKRESSRPLKRIKKLGSGGTLAKLLLKTKSKKRVNLVNRDICAIGNVNTSTGQAIAHLFLGNNHITSLSGIENLHNLKSLSCANNLIRGIHGLSYLSSCPNLEELYLCGNPVTSIPYYREHVISTFRQLKVLDGKPIKAQEVHKAKVVILEEHTWMNLLFIDDCTITKLNQSIRRLRVHVQLLKLIYGKKFFTKRVDIDPYKINSEKMLDLVQLQIWSDPEYRRLQEDEFRFRVKSSQKQDVNEFFTLHQTFQAQVTKKLLKVECLVSAFNSKRAHFMKKLVKVPLRLTVVKSSAKHQQRTSMKKSQTEFEHMQLLNEKLKTKIKIFHHHNKHNVEKATRAIQRLREENEALRRKLLRSESKCVALKMTNGGEGIAEKLTERLQDASTAGLMNPHAIPLIEVIGRAHSSSSKLQALTTWKLTARYNKLARSQRNKINIERMGRSLSLWRHNFGLNQRLKALSIRRKQRSTRRTLKKWKKQMKRRFKMHQQAELAMYHFLRKWFNRWTISRKRKSRLYRCKLSSARLADACFTNSQKAKALRTWQKVLHSKKRDQSRDHVRRILVKWREVTAMQKNAKAASTVIEKICLFHKFQKWRISAEDSRASQAIQKYEERLQQVLFLKLKGLCSRRSYLRMQEENMLKRYFSKWELNVTKLKVTKQQEAAIASFHRNQLDSRARNALMKWRTFVQENKLQKLNMRFLSQKVRTRWLHKWRMAVKESKMNRLQEHIDELTEDLSNAESVLHTSSDNLMDSSMELQQKSEQIATLQKRVQQTETDYQIEHRKNKKLCAAMAEVTKIQRETSPQLAEAEERRSIEAGHFRSKLSNEVLQTIFEVLTKLQSELQKGETQNSSADMAYEWHAKISMFHSTLERTKDMIAHFLNDSLIWQSD